MINLNIEMNQNFFPGNSKPQTIYGLIRIKPESIKGRIPLDVKFLIDRSGSMTDMVINNGTGNILDDLIDQLTNNKKYRSVTKLKLVKTAMKEVIDRLAINDRISIITFASRAKKVASEIIKNDSDKKMLKDSVDKIQSDGNTNMSQAIELTLNNTKFDSNRVKRVIIFTDGEVNQPSVKEAEKNCINLAKKAEKMRLPFTTFGTGTTYNDRFLTKLAHITSGRMEHISDPAKVIDVFNEEIAVLGDIAITNLEAILETKPDVKLREVSRVIPDIIPVNLSSPNYVFINLGDIDRARGQAILFQAEIPPLSNGTHEIGTLQVIFDVPSSNLIGQKAEMKININCTDDQSLYKANEDVLSTLQLAGATKLQTLALDRADAGDTENAVKLMGQVYTLYTKLGQDDLATKVKTLTNAIKTKGEISGDNTDIRRTLTTKSRQTISRRLTTK